MIDTTGMNRLQRWYFRWAQPHYERMPLPLRAEVERIDRWLYSRASLGFWCGVAAGLAGASAGLWLAGLPWWLAVVSSLTIGGAALFAALAAWLQPERVLGGRLGRWLLWWLLGGYLGAACGFVLARLAKAREQSLDAATLAPLLLEAFRATTIVLLVMLTALVLLMWASAQARRVRMNAELAQLKLTQERDAAAREAAEARLKLLQAQIQPHFIFNTLAALQHWVDTGDTRASPLLASLTGFLRGSTELLSRDEVTLAEEAQRARHYLEIMQARLGERLRFSIDVADAAAAQALPAGVLLTLVENAVEHGIAPSLSGGDVQVAAQQRGDAFVLAVRNTGVPLAAGWREGVGLANCRERLRHRFGERSRLTLSATDGGCVAQLLIGTVSP
jgi:hypothetical protein